MNFTEENKKSRDLYDEAQELYVKLIRPLFSSLELETFLIGSADYNVMTYRDIDMLFCANDANDFKKFSDSIMMLKEVPGMWSVHFKDNTVLVDPYNNIPRMTITLKYCKGSNISEHWKIDCSMYEKEIFEREYGKNLLYKDQIIGEVRNTILKTKQIITENNNGTMPIGISSKIYDAVINEGVLESDLVLQKLGL